MKPKRDYYLRKIDTGWNGFLYVVAHRDHEPSRIFSGPWTSRDHAVRERDRLNEEG